MKINQRTLLSSLKISPSKIHSAPLIQSIGAYIVVHSLIVAILYSINQTIVEVNAGSVKHYCITSLACFGQLFHSTTPTKG